QNIRVVNLGAHSTENPTGNLCDDDCWLAWNWSPDGTKLLYWSKDQRKIGLLDVASRRRTILLEHPEYALLRAYFSPDQQWIMFIAIIRPGIGKIFIAPFRGAGSISPEHWISATDPEVEDNVPRWSPDGNLLYFNSKRDGYQCLYAQRLDASTKNPIG